MRFLNARNRRVERMNQRTNAESNDLSWVDQAAKAPPPTMQDVMEGMSWMQ